MFRLLFAQFQRGKQISRLRMPSTSCRIPIIEDHFHDNWFTILYTYRKSHTTYPLLYSVSLCQVWRDESSQPVLAPGGEETEKRINTQFCQPFSITLHHWNIFVDEWFMPHWSHSDIDLLKCREMSGECGEARKPQSWVLRERPEQLIWNSMESIALELSLSFNTI